MDVLGIDAGGSKTVAWLADQEGRVLGEGRGSGANLHSAGELATEKALYDVIHGALGERPAMPEVVAVGMAGMDRPDDEAVVRGILRRLGCRGQIVAVNDAHIALVAGADELPGVVIIAGTGSIAYGIGPAGTAARAGGWGEVYGDEGSAFWVGARALAAVVRAADRRGPTTALTALVLRHAGAERIDQLVRHVHTRPDRRPFITAMAGLVARADADGDAVAGEILRAATDELTLAARSVVEQLGMRGDRFHVVLSGGLFKMAPVMASLVAARVTDFAPRATTGLLTDEPALGAVRLARRAAEGRLRLPVYAGAPPGRP
ncbi:MAG: BadF/BadG/BcrA/BcrD ATPase family protein [Vicinamibacterales bacterium]